ncbi:MAG: LytTR family DNA-binding domain-containing protein [Eubacteriales bacterium]|nr:LytTR family DNA-binding domain-containing protein [Eubacteriales bacterium]
MLLQIVICDDDAQTVSSLRDMLLQCLKSEGYQANIRVYSTGEDFLKDPAPYDVLFMDIFMPGKNGMDIVREMQADAVRHTVFITSSHDFAIAAFQVRAAHYLLKPLQKKDVQEALGRCLSDLAKDQVLQVKMGHDTLPVAMRSIRYIEVYNKQSILHTVQGDIETHTTLDYLYGQLDSNLFIKAQRSFIVNMAYIQSFQSDRLLLKNGTIVMLSRSSKAELKKQYQAYLFRLARRCGI